MTTKRAVDPTRIFADGLWLVLLLVLAPAQAEDRSPTSHVPTTLTVEITGALPGFSTDEASEYLATQMGQAGVAGWLFVPMSTAAPLVADRIEYRIEQAPYAGGGVRQFIPIPSVQRLFGTHHNISVEARLYLGGQYQTLALGEALVQGGPRDKVLGNLVMKLTQDLLGEHGAYRSIEVSSPNAPEERKSPP